MTMRGQIHWHEGLFLQPHHLQLMNRQIFEQIVQARKLSWSYPYGLVESRISTDELENLRIRFDRLRVIMPSGIEVNVPETTDLPPLDIKKEFTSNSGSFTISLGVPIWYDSRGNTIEMKTTSEDEAGGTGGVGGDDWHTKRLFRLTEEKHTDENDGSNPQDIQVRRINARLLLDKHDKTDLEHIPILRIVHGTGEDVGMPKLDPAFVPPCLVVNGSPKLREYLRDLASQVVASRTELVNQINRGGFSVDTMRGVQFEQMLRLRTLNRFAGSLPSRVASGSTSPFEVYLELRELLGELAALQPDRDQFEAPAYDHDNPMLSLEKVCDNIRKLLRGAVAPSFIHAPFILEEGILALTLTDEHLTAPNEYYIGIKTREEYRKVAQLVEDTDKFKLMAKSMINQRVWGVRLTEERQPPLELPSQTGLHYFRLQRSDSARMWDRICKEKAVAIRWPDMPSSDFSITLYMTVPDNKKG